LIEAHALLRLRLGAEAAQRAAQALRPDDDAFVTTRAEVDMLIVDVRAATLRSLVRALEDVLANVAVSEDLLRARPIDDE
jgi:transcription factor Pcc1